MRTRCGPCTAAAPTLAVEMSTSKVLDVIQRQPETVMPLPDAILGASATAAGGLAKAASTTSNSNVNRIGLQRRAVDRRASGPCGADIGISLLPVVRGGRPTPAQPPSVRGNLS